MIYTKKFIVFIALTITIVLLVVCFNSEFGSKGRFSGDFWRQLGVQKEEVDEIRLIFQDQIVILEENKATAFLDTLTSLEEKEVVDQHEFTPSDISVVFVTDGEEQEVTFYWFPYKKILADGAGVIYAGSNQKLPQITGNRVDVTIEGKKYHFSFSTDQMWTEELMCQAYDQCAEYQGLKKMYQLRGGDYYDNVESAMLEEMPTAVDILDSSDIVFLGTFLTQAYNHHPGDFAHVKSIEIFRIDEVLKGTADEMYYNILSEHTANRAYMDSNYEAVTIVNESFYNPVYQKGNQYLICVDTDKDDIYQTFCQYGTAVVDGDTLFPRFNTEEHPFYNVKIQTVRDLLEEMQPSQKEGTVR